ncbi:hypothetical protein DPMN_165958 [Dreissena polymorpha]|uniref:Uncharacterized protein n=1 Tax=Dreissena polymorpha TaxID=45954 RepID=A0A9D4EY48_DREPO|nr:hypothetical protein DPMN_165949 [Dreissena polymorpha]KAH3787829.1 hypothetical protein DPMN_165958 [Dreissena polymorpha]
MADTDCSESIGKIKRSRQFFYRENEVLQACMETHFKRLTAKHASGGSNPNTKAIQDKV